MQLHRFYEQFKGLNVFFVMNEVYTLNEGLIWCDKNFTDIDFSPQDP